MLHNHGHVVACSIAICNVTEWHYKVPNRTTWITRGHALCPLILIKNGVTNEDRFWIYCTNSHEEEGSLYCNYIWVLIHCYVLEI